jgi:hypothetical protein
MNFSWEGLFRFCEVVSIIAGAVTVSALIGQVMAGRVLSSRKDAETQQLMLAVATQQERAARAEQTLVEVQQKTRDRHLTPGLAEALTALAKRHPNQTLAIVERSGNSEEARRLADLIASALQAGGWRIERKRQSLITAHPIYGLYCAFNKSRDQAIANEFVVLFQQNGLRFEFWGDMSDRLPLTLEVGLKQ